MRTAEQMAALMKRYRVDTLEALVESLADHVDQLRKDAREAEREFQRDARDIAAQATMDERDRHADGYF